MKTLKYSLVVCAAMAASINSSGSRESIVGSWQQSRSQCQSNFGRLDIGPKSLGVFEEVGCDFRSVERQGDTVIWKGACTFFGAGETAERKSATVIATLRPDRRLDVRLAGGGDIATRYERCGR
jgi:hypothetical protein